MTDDESRIPLTGGGEFFTILEKREDAMKKLFAMTIIMLGLAGCGQVYDREPVGIGFDNDELKLSPCACLKVYNG